MSDAELPSICKRAVNEAFAGLLDVRCWSNAMEILSEPMSRDGLVFMRTIGPRVDDDTMLAINIHDPVVAHEYNSHYRNINPFTDALERAVPIFSGVEFAASHIDLDMVAKTEFANEFMFKFGLDLNGCTISLCASARRTTNLHVEFGVKERPGTSKAMADLLALAQPAMAHATRLQERMNATRMRDATQMVIDTLPMATIALDKTQCVVNANRAAEAILGDGPVFINRALKMVGRTPFTDALLQYVVMQSLGLGLTSTVRIKHYGGCGDLLVTGTPLAGDRARQWAMIPDEDAPAALLYLMPASNVPPEAVSTLVRVCGVDAQTARAAVDIYAGKGRSASPELLESFNVFSEAELVRTLSLVLQLPR